MKSKLSLQDGDAEGTAKQTKIEKYIAAIRTDNMNTNTVSLPAPLELDIDAHKQSQLARYI